MDRRRISHWLATLALILSVVACNLLTAPNPTNPPSERTARPSIPVAPGTTVLPAGSTPELSPTGSPAQTVAPAATGQTYYVAVNQAGASDENNGRFANFQGGLDGPWLTLQHAAEVMKAGDATYVREGIYYEEGITFANSGEEGAPITLTNYESEKVVLDGSMTGGEELPGILFVDGQGHYVIRGLTVQNMGWSGIYTDEAARKPFKDITIRDCTLHDNRWSGIDLSAVDGFLVEKVEAYNNGYYGLNIHSSEDGALSSMNGIVRNSSFHDHTGKEGHGLAINQGHDIVIRDNVAYHNRIHGFDVSDWPKRGELSYNIALERNFSYDNGMNGFAINSDSHHVSYRYNIAWRNGADWAGRGSASGFLCYEGCWHVEWYNNLSVENSDAGFWVKDEFGSYSKPGDNLLVFKNNITYGNRYGTLVVEGKKTWQVLAEYNDWSAPPDQELVLEDQGKTYSVMDLNNGLFQIGNISIDPRFVNISAPDFHLLPDSPLIDAGIDVGLPYCGSAPDLGAYEVCP